jgi:UDPglucose--hexose-1-phosphate uridylyltransferase
MPQKKSEIRKDYLLDKYVVITPLRALRPRDTSEKTIIKRTNNCPFCNENINQENIQDKIDVRGAWQVLDLKNIYPAVSLDNKKAYGIQEVIIETPVHTKELADLNVAEIEMVLKMYARRTSIISHNPRINYILCLKNQGSKAGASIIHSHSQILATAFIPPEIRTEQKAVQDYKKKNGSCPYCDIIKKEMKSSRKIFTDKFVAAFAPYASQYHYEVWIFTKRHIDNITQLNENEIKSFARILKLILKKLNNLNLSFNYFFHQIISDTNQHFYLKIQPRDSVWAGIELGTGLVINSVPPEDAARYYKK